MKTTLTLTVEWRDAADPQLPIPSGWQEDLTMEGFTRAKEDYAAGFTSGELGLEYHTQQGRHLYRGHWTVTETKEA